VLLRQPRTNPGLPRQASPGAALPPGGSGTTPAPCRCAPGARGRRQRGPSLGRAGAQLGDHRAPPRWPMVPRPFRGGALPYPALRVGGGPPLGRTAPAPAGALAADTAAPPAARPPPAGPDRASAGRPPRGTGLAPRTRAGPRPTGRRAATAPGPAAARVGGAGQRNLPRGRPGRAEPRRGPAAGAPGPAP